MISRFLQQSKEKHLDYINSADPLKKRICIRNDLFLVLFTSIRKSSDVRINDPVRISSPNISN